MLKRVNLNEAAKEAGLLTRREAANCLNVTIRTLDNLVARGTLPQPIRRQGRWVRFVLEDIQEYIERRIRRDGQPAKPIDQRASG